MSAHLTLNYNRKRIKNSKDVENITNPRNTEEIGNISKNHLRKVIYEWIISSLHGIDNLNDVYMVQNIEKDGIFPNSFYKASITLTAKSTKDKFEKSYMKQ